jgi:hypothetical protein
VKAKAKMGSTGSGKKQPKNGRAESKKKEGESGARTLQSFFAKNAATGDGQ